jgi:hypothetical protein
MYTYTHTCILDLLRRVLWSTRSQIQTPPRVQNTHTKMHTYGVHTVNIQINLHIKSTKLHETGISMYVPTLVYIYVYTRTCRHCWTSPHPGADAHVSMHCRLRCAHAYPHIWCVHTYIHVRTSAHPHHSHAKTHTTHKHSNLAIAGDEARGASGHPRPVVVNND